MLYHNRDMGINHIRARKDHSCYGMGLGIIILDEVYPGFPGDVRNASAYPFPIQYEIAQGVDIHNLVMEEDKSPCLEPVQRAAKKLEKMGCRAIAAECGYFAYFQKDIAGYVDVPVFMSSMLQVPWAQQLVGPKKVVGILAASKAALTDAHLEAVGVELGSNYVVGGATDDGRCPQFENLWHADKRPDPPQAFYDQAERDFVAVAVDFFQSYPNMGAMVLECTGFPPFARALQRVIDIPIFSWGTLLDYAYSVVVHRDYYGHVQEEHEPDLLFRRQPQLCAPSLLVHNASGGDVDTVILEGKILIHSMKLLCVDKAELLTDARAACARLFERAGGEGRDAPSKRKQTKEIE